MYLNRKLSKSDGQIGEVSAGMKVEEFGVCKGLVVEATSASGGDCP